jgi:hypothetical protein
LLTFWCRREWKSKTLFASSRKAKKVEASRSRRSSGVAALRIHAARATARGKRLPTAWVGKAQNPTIARGANQQVASSGKSGKSPFS